LRRGAESPEIEGEELQLVGTDGEPGNLLVSLLGFLVPAGFVSPGGSSPSSPPLLGSSGVFPEAALSSSLLPLLGSSGVLPGAALLGFAGPPECRSSGGCFLSSVAGLSVSSRASGLGGGLSSSRTDATGALAAGGAPAGGWAPGVPMVSMLAWVRRLSSTVGDGDVDASVDDVPAFSTPGGLGGSSSGASIREIVAKRRLLVPSPLSRAAEMSSYISAFEIWRAPPVRPRVVLVIADMLESGFAGADAGGAEKVTLMGTPLPHAGAPVGVAAGAGAPAVGAAAVVVVAAVAAVDLFGQSFALCPVCLQMKQVNDPSAL
jgi:hypothetical protein